MSVIWGFYFVYSELLSDKSKILRTLPQELPVLSGVSVSKYCQRHRFGFDFFWGPVKIINFNAALADIFRADAGL